ncbi:MAG: cytochrome c maturation protein CcmE domain-containing protein [Acidimicrobiales bacterium]|jgi:cytochrome c-type biogenesis protein CcmE
MAVRSADLAEEPPMASRFGAGGASPGGASPGGHGTGSDGMGPGGSGGSGGFGAGGNGPPPFPMPRRRRAFATRRQKLVAGVVVVGALSFLLFRGLTNALNYYLPANQAVAQRAKLGTSDFRIQGTVQPGLRDTSGKLYFTISSHKVDVRVVSTGSPSQLFRVGIPVVLDGHWQGPVFSSFQIMVQHGATYSPAKEAHPKVATAVAGER